MGGCAELCKCVVSAALVDGGDAIQTQAGCIKKGFGWLLGSDGSSFQSVTPSWFVCFARARTRARAGLLGPVRSLGVGNEGKHNPVNSDEEAVRSILPLAVWCVGRRSIATGQVCAAGHPIATGRHPSTPVSPIATGCDRMRWDAGKHSTTH
ncbi:hypothetical protein BGZ61DRAFT_519232 [Ilyonectria robusta]|uniref:uncharacterized protein n=1 Tax=Ilyonectria robusta TaxID=1079257 RepID=UPI001E8E6836|nr:uncharacterized protein BGZ61DRAFT_519232 [Ilyonectria robusta]KAH8686593.1 hypothetical protein BGZ61DRAFT_519232 [Ilyonectria robusta]